MALDESGNCGKPRAFKGSSDIVSLARTDGFIEIPEGEGVAKKNKDYPYYSSFSPALLNHSRENTLDLIDSRNLNAESLIVELASNDGYLLQYFVSRGIPVLGIEPAANVALAAEKKGVKTKNGMQIVCEMASSSPLDFGELIM